MSRAVVVTTSNTVFELMIDSNVNQSHETERNVTKTIIKEFSKEMIFLLIFNIAFLLTSILLIHTTKSFLKSIPPGRKLVCFQS